MKKITLALFIIMILAQWIVPGKMIWDSEEVIATGELYKFETTPIDPSDPFRGKYVTLNFKIADFVIDSSSSFQQGQTIYVVIKSDSEGFAKIDTLLHKAPQIENYVKAIVAGFHFNANHKQVGRIEYPFNRFYVEESKASKAEGLYTNSQMDTSQVAYALVRVKMGKAILQDVRINERSIVDLVEEINRQKANITK